MEKEKIILGDEILKLRELYLELETKLNNSQHQSLWEENNYISQLKSENRII